MPTGHPKSWEEIKTTRWPRFGGADFLSHLRHEQPIRHPIWEVPNDCRLGSRDGYRQRLAGCLERGSCPALGLICYV